VDRLSNILVSYLNQPELILTIGLLTGILFIVLLILWLMLPFAIFRTKKRLDQIIDERQKANSWFEGLIAKNHEMNTRLSEIISERKRATDWLSKAKPEATSEEEPGIHLDVTQEPINDPSDNREHPRLELHCTGVVMGEQATVRDISLGGLFVEPDNVPELLKIGQITNLDIDLPTESESLRMKVKIVSQNESGFGCKYFDLTRYNQNAINNCFHKFKDTLPVFETFETGEISADQDLTVDVVEPYHGSASSKIFHKKECKYAKRSRMMFSNREDAVNSGYKPCKICHP
jgi:hypothetical protein